jgi:hypothetical protein
MLTMHVACACVKLLRLISASRNRSGGVPVAVEVGAGVDAVVAGLLPVLVDDGLLDEELDPQPASASNAIAAASQSLL